MPVKARLETALPARPGPENRLLARKTHKKEPPEGGSRFSQGGVKQSGQEPLNVQKLDGFDNGGETLTYG